MLKTLAKNKFIVSSALAVIGYNLANFLQFLANLCLIKTVSVELYGEYTAAIAYNSIASIPFSILLLIIIKLVGEKPASARAAYLRILESRLLASLKRWWWWLLPGVIGLGWFLLNYTNLTDPMSTVYVLTTCVVGMIITLYSGYLQGKRQFSTYYQATILASFIKLIGFVGIYLIGGNLMVAYLILMVAQLMSLVFQRHFALGSNHQSTHLKIKITPFRLAHFIRRREVWLPALTTAGLLTFINGDSVIVKKFLTASEAGYYGALALFGKMIGYALTPVAEVTFAFAAGKETKKHQYKNLLLTTIFFALAGGGATLVYYLAAPWLIPIFTTNEYLFLAPWLPAMAVFGTIHTFCSLFGKQLLSSGHLVAAASLVLVSAQLAGLWFFHQDFTQIMTVNIAASGVLLIIYLVSLFRLKTKEATS